MAFNTVQLIVKNLSAFASRPVSSDQLSDIFRVFEESIKNPSVQISKQEFYSPYHFLQILYWLFGGFIMALALLHFYPLASVIISVLMLIMGFLYFDWRYSPLITFPPLTKCYNFIGSQRNQNAKLKIVLMAHWDTAPISIPYRPEFIKGLKSSVFTGLFFMILTTVLCSYVMLVGGSRITSWLGFILIAYYVIQLVIVSIDFWRYGYSNGANDNATGCAAAISVANKLWDNITSDVEVELCITGAEEVGMLGARQYYLSHKKHNNRPVYIINFDTIGCENLQAITESGTFTTISYYNELMNMARKVAHDENIEVNFSPYQTADTDTAWFARAGMESMTLISYNSQGLPGHIHRPEDTIDKIHWETVYGAIDFTTLVCNKLIEENLT